ncbi:TPA: minor capsid protein [Streptococcus suis]
MGRANVSVRVDFDKIEKMLSPASVKRGKLAMTSQALLDMDQYVPMRSGVLRASARGTDVGVEYSTPYARAQYYGSSYNKHRSFTFNNYTTPGTGKRWDMRVSPEKKRQWGIKGLQAMGVRT